MEYKPFTDLHGEGSKDTKCRKVRRRSIGAAHKLRLNVIEHAFSV